jgi:hypothetical protein
MSEDKHKTINSNNNFADCGSNVVNDEGTFTRQ